MGYKGVVLSEAGHYEEFVCSICQQLVDLDESVLTTCSHVFCSVCLQNWLLRKRSCPTCQRDLSYVNTSALVYLKTGNPLAWRVLSRVKIQCPLPSCSWSGDYSELQSHLVNTTAHTALNSAASLSSSTSSQAPSSSTRQTQEPPPKRVLTDAERAQQAAENKTLAKGLNDQAVEKFAAHNYTDALRLYTKAIETYRSIESSSGKTQLSVKDADLSDMYVDRANVYFVLGKYLEGLDDVVNAVKFDRMSVNAWMRGGMLLNTLGKFNFCKNVWLAAVPESIRNSDSRIINLKKDAEYIAENLQFLNRVLSPMEIDLGRPPHGGFLNFKRYAIDFAAKMLEQSTGVNCMLVQARVEIEFGSLTKGIKTDLSALKKLVNEKNDNFMGQLEALFKRIQNELEVDEKIKTAKLFDMLNGDETSDLDVYVCLAIAQLYNGAFDEAMKFVKQSLTLAPDYRVATSLFKKIKLYRDNLASADKSSSNKDFENAAKLLSELITINLSKLGDVDPIGVHTQLSESEKQTALLRVRYDSPLLANIFAERGTIYLKMQEYDKALNDCKVALKIQDDCKRAWLTKAYVLQAQEKYQEAVNELRPIMDSWGQSDTVIKSVFDRSEFLVKKSQRPDYYKILSSPENGITLSSLSSEKEIKHAYKKKALESHPDKVGSESENEFKLVNEAFDVLNDQRKKQLYDEGYDKQTIEDMINRQNRDSHRH